MAEVKKYIAIDLGAESGRVMLGSVSAKLTVEAIKYQASSFFSSPAAALFHHVPLIL